MKKGILIIVLGFIGVATYAQNNTSRSQQFNNTTSKLIKPKVLRITDSMSNDDIGLELINNFYKIELSDLTINKKIYTSENQNKQYNDIDLSIKNNTKRSNYNIILDLAVRTTEEMRPSLDSTEEKFA